MRARIILLGIGIGLGLAVFDSEPALAKAKHHVKKPLKAVAEASPSISNAQLEASAGSYPFGIDVSKWQGDLLKNMKDPGFSFIICKATEGENDVDPHFDDNWRLIQEKKLVRGCYHFYIATKDPIVQADHYLDTLGSWRLFWQSRVPSSNLPPIVDIEGRGVPPTTNIDQLHRDLFAFLQRIEEQTHRKPMIYTSVWFANKYLNDPRFSQYPLWIAHYNSEAVSPPVPQAWTGKSPKFWQKSNRYVMNKKWTDFNVFLGSLDELKSGQVEGSVGKTSDNWGNSSALE